MYDSFDLISIRRLSNIAIERSQYLKCTYAEFRFEKKREETIITKELNVASIIDDTSLGYGVRVIYKDTWGFAAGNIFSDIAVISTVDKAFQIADALSSNNLFSVHLAKENACFGDYLSDFRINPFDVPLKEKIDYMIEVSSLLKSEKKINMVTFSMDFIAEYKYLLTSIGTETVQKRLRSYPVYEACSLDKKIGNFITLTSESYPVGMGYEAIEGFDFLKQVKKTAEDLEEMSHAESVPSGQYDVVIDPSNLWLVIHETIGHATELDRIAGYEADFAGTSFATIDKLFKLKYGSSLVNVVADRTQKYGLATIGFDDEGVKSDQWHLIKEGILVDYQYNREIANRYNFPQSNGCSYADSWSSIPIQRMPNISLLPGKENYTTKDLIGHISNGIYIVGDKSWSIDMQRLNFQFTGQKFYKIKQGKITGMYKNVAYQGNTPTFWNDCQMLGGEKTYQLYGSFECGKGQPEQSAPVSHGCPSALFTNVTILNTENEN